MEKGAHRMATMEGAARGGRAAAVGGGLLCPERGGGVAFIVD
jgi:hypothetical protein